MRISLEMRNNWPLCGLVLVCGLLAGCPASPPAPLDRPPAAPPGVETYRVERGDTLYSIAFRHNLDWRELAHWNAIGPPHTIYPGQELRLQPTGSRPVPPPDERPPVAVLERPDVGEARDLPPPPEQDQPPPEDVPSVDRDVSPEPVVVEVVPESVPEPEVEVPEETEPAAETRAPPPPAAERSVAGVRWRWPTEGAMVRGFDASATRKGVGIAGNEGQPVVAAADGSVVYSGTGLLGYGELIIIKHTDNLLSAYGHNRRRLVAEGDRIEGGQAIAEMGRNERNEVMLHFEIRNNGQPENPLQYLPQR